MYAGWSDRPVSLTIRCWASGTQVIKELQINTHNLIQLHGPYASMLSTHRIKVHQKKDSADYSWLVDLVGLEASGRGLIFALTKNEAEDVAAELNRAGVEGKAAYYHSAMTKDDKDRV